MSASDSWMQIFFVNFVRILIISTLPLREEINSLYIRIKAVTDMFDIGKRYKEVIWTHIPDAQ